MKPTPQQLAAAQAIKLPLSICSLDDGGHYHIEQHGGRVIQFGDIKAMFDADTEWRWTKGWTGITFSIDKQEVCALQADESKRDASLFFPFESEAKKLAAFIGERMEKIITLHDLDTTNPKPWKLMLSGFVRFESPDLDVVMREAIKTVQQLTMGDVFIRPDENGTDWSIRLRHEAVGETEAATIFR